MKKLLFLLSLIGLLINCNSKPVEKPNDLINEDMMVDILYDLYVINGMKSSDMKYLEDRGIKPAKYIYQKYKIDSLQFAKSDHYYATDVDGYARLYERVTLRLQRNKAAIDSLIAKEPKEKKEDSIIKTTVISHKLRDSLRKKRILKKTLFSDSLKN